MNIDNLRSFICSLSDGNTPQKAHLESEFYGGAEEWIIRSIKSKITSEAFEGNYRPIINLKSIMLDRDWETDKAS